MIISPDVVYEAFYASESSQLVQNDIVSEYLYPISGGVTAKYLNKCIDGITGQWHFWLTDAADINGIYYIGSGGQQFDADTYQIQSIAYTREQV